MSNQLDLFNPERKWFGVATTTDVDSCINDWMPVAIGVSGGKDSTAAAWATINHLNRLNHRGQRILIHSDLGRTEWKQSLHICQQLSDQLKTELVVVKREKGDMMDRWLQRWSDNVARYVNLECVKLILPWSTPAMRFCTSELKTAIISRELVRRFPNKTILSVTGIRREESSNRARMPVSQRQTSLTSAAKMTTGYAWNPIIDWKLRDEVWPLHHQYNLPIHEAYTTFGASRVSCAFCIMSASDDIQAALKDERNHDLYREIVSLEIVSTFGFQGNWLADARPELIDNEMKYMLNQSKRAAQYRQTMEAKLPQHLHYTKGWPTCIPSETEALLLSIVRKEVAYSVGIDDMKYTEPADIILRYQELYDVARSKEQRSSN